MTDPHEDLVEAVARKMAAMTMRLVKDLHGMQLPKDLWKQTMPQARDILALIAERTKDATPEMAEARDKNKLGYWFSVNAWNDMHRASPLWPKEKS